jgi:hypothetical protein
VIRSATAGAHISARLAPTATAISFIDNCAVTGTMPTTWCTTPPLKVASASNVLNTRSASTPSARAAASP